MNHPFHQRLTRLRHQVQSLPFQRGQTQNSVAYRQPLNLPQRQVMYQLRCPSLISQPFHLRVQRQGIRSRLQPIRRSSQQHLLQYYRPVYPLLRLRFFIRFFRLRCLQWSHRWLRPMNLVHCQQYPPRHYRVGYRRILRRVHRHLDLAPPQQCPQQICQAWYSQTLRQVHRHLI